MKEIKVRIMNIKDFYNLHKMYNSLSYTTKRFFHPGFLGFRELSIKWFILQLALILSTNPIYSKIMKRIFPQAVFLPIVAINTKNEVVGFAFIKIKEKLANQGFIGDLGIVVKESYQGKGIGKKLMGHLIGYAKKENIRRINLTVLTENLRAIKLYKSYGFTERKIIKGGDYWRGQILDCIEMTLHLATRENSYY